MCPVSSFAVYFAEFDNRHRKILRVIRRAGMLLVLTTCLLLVVSTKGIKDGICPEIVGDVCAHGSVEQLSSLKNENETKEGSAALERSLRPSLRLARV